jgi:hypothetical protein
MTSPDISLQDRLLPELDRELLMSLAPLADRGLGGLSYQGALGSTVPTILRTGRTLRYIEAVVSSDRPSGWLFEQIKADANLREICRQAMMTGGDLLASHHANELLDGDQPRIKAIGVLIKQQSAELEQIEARKPRRNTCWTDA